jgi:hypothetical protein
MRLNEIRRKVGRYQKRFFLKSSDTVGEIKTRFRGSGLQFKEHQVYAPGDDVRFIDWKILAKTSTPFIKTFEEERSTKIHCVVDIGRSMLMGRDGVSKLQLSLEFCAFLYYIAEKARDRVSITLVGDKVIRIQTGYGEAAVKRLLRVLNNEEIITDKDTLRIAKAEWPSLDENLFYSEVKISSLKMNNVLVLSDFLDLENLEAVVSLGNRNMHLVRISNGFELEKEFYSMPYLSSLKKGIFNRIKVNSDFHSSVEKKTKLLSIRDNFVDDFKEIIKV